MNVISIDGFTLERMTLVEKITTSQKDVISKLKFRFKLERQDTLLKSRVSDLYTYITNQ